MLFRLERRTVALLVCFTTCLMATSNLNAVNKKECSDKAKKGSRDYSVMGRIGRGSDRRTPYSSITGSGARYGSSSGFSGGFSRGTTGSTRNRHAYSMEYQHCMSSFGG